MNLGWRIALIRFCRGQVCETVSWMLRNLPESGTLWTVPSLGRQAWDVKEGSWASQEAVCVLSWFLLVFLSLVYSLHFPQGCVISCSTVFYQNSRQTYEIRNQALTAFLDDLSSDSSNNIIDPQLPVISPLGVTTPSLPTVGVRACTHTCTHVHTHTHAAN